MLSLQQSSALQEAVLRFLLGTCLRCGDGIRDETALILFPLLKSIMDSHSKVYVFMLVIL